MSKIAIHPYLHVRSAYNPRFHADGQRLSFISDYTGVPQVWEYEECQGWPNQASFTNERMTFVEMIRGTGDTERRIVGMDAGGNERQQLFVLEANGNLRRLTDDDTAIYKYGGLSPCGQWLSWASNERDQAFFDVYIHHLPTGKTERVMEKDGTFSVLDWHPSGRSLLICEHHSNLDADLGLLDLKDGAVRWLTVHEGEAVFTNPYFDPNGNHLFFLTNVDREFVGLAKLDLNRLHLQWLHTAEWDLEGLAMDEQRTRCAYTMNAGGISCGFVYDLSAARCIKWELPAHAGQGVIGGLHFSPDGNRLACVVNTPLSPTDIWMVGTERLPTEQTAVEQLHVEQSPIEQLHVEQSPVEQLHVEQSPVEQLHVEQHVVRLPIERFTYASRSPLVEQTLTEPDLIEVTSFDGLTVPSFYYRPADTEGPYPVVVLVHGGPESQTKAVYHPVIQYLINRGFAVCAPNVRGSSGYGKTYVNLDNVRKRMHAVRDLIAVAEWLKSEGGADPARIAVMGGSYGGFMVLAALTHFPDVFHAGVNIVGISSFRTFLENTGPWRRKLREAEYGTIEEDGDFFDQIDPLHHTDRITAPLMVIHGANDPRVPVSEAEQIIADLEQRQHPVEYIRFEDEGHGIVKLHNRMEAYTRVAHFLERIFRLDGNGSTSSKRR
jgi:dipeptidyl aminopeptidase/acylaminoacyl peptidase